MRPRSGRAIAGVAVGTAAHLGQDPLVVRVAFALLATTGIGIVAYGLLWLTMPVAAPGDEQAGRALAGGARYIAAVGTVEPRKDLPGLVAAFDLVAADDPDLRLVIAGADGWGADALTVAIGRSPHAVPVRT